MRVAEDSLNFVALATNVEATGVIDFSDGHIDTVVEVGAVGGHGTGLDGRHTDFDDVLRLCGCRQAQNGANNQCCAFHVCLPLSN